MKSARFNLKSARFYEICQISCEICRILKDQLPGMVMPMFGPLKERPILDHHAKAHILKSSGFHEI